MYQNTDYAQLGNLDIINKDIAMKLLSNDNLVKLLYYNETDCLLKDIPSDNEKYAMIDQIDLSNTHIFFNPMPPIVQDEAYSQIRFFDFDVRPNEGNNVYLSEVTFCFQVIVHFTLWSLDNGSVRARQLYTEILKTLNGTAVNGGIGLITFKRPITYSVFSNFHNGYNCYANIKLSG